MALLNNKQVILHTMKRTPKTVYLTQLELIDLVNTLPSQDLKLYGHLLDLAAKNPTPEQFETVNLAKALNVKEGVIRKSRASLVKHEYLIIEKFKDYQGDKMVRVVLGKEPVRLYKLGIKVSISNAKAYKEILKKFPIDNPTLTQEERNKLVEEANNYYMNQ